jgi:hypothetical protein
MSRCRPIKIFGFVLLGLAGCSYDRAATVVISNVSDTEITLAVVNVSGSTLTAKMIAPSESKELPFQITDESAYQVVVAFRDGRKLEAELGYVTALLTHRDVIEVSETAIVLQGTPPSEVDDEAL